MEGARKSASLSRTLWTEFLEQQESLDFFLPGSPPPCPLPPPQSPPLLAVARRLKPARMDSLLKVLEMEMGFFPVIAVS